MSIRGVEIEGKQPSQPRNNRRQFQELSLVRNCIKCRISRTLKQNHPGVKKDTTILVTPQLTKPECAKGQLQLKSADYKGHQHKLACWMVSPRFSNDCSLIGKMCFLPFFVNHKQQHMCSVHIYNMYIDITERSALSCMKALLVLK